MDRGKAAVIAAANEAVMAAIGLGLRVTNWVDGFRRCP
jgi:hypothetical protein